MTVMTADPHLIERSVDLKQQLVAFIQQSRFERAVRQALLENFGPYPPVEDEGFANFVDRFLLEARLPDGRTVVETFVAEHPELLEEERAMLLGWRDAVEGIFEVERRDGEALVVVNLVDDLTYRVRANTGPAAFRQMPRRSFLSARLIPIGDEWLLSGATSVLPAMAQADVYGVAAELATRFPHLVFRNPEKLAQAWELQREERRIFSDFFGSDLVVLPGHELAERMRAYARYRHDEARDEEGKTVAERVKAERGAPTPHFDVPFAADFTTAETVGIMYDETEGLAFFIDFGTVEETFANPALVDDRKHRQAVRTYLHNESVSPLPLRRLAARDPEQASQVFQRLMKNPRFSWERDGEALLRKHKASFFDRPAFPAVLPLSDRLARARRTAPAGQPGLPDFPLARPRKKGSWKPARRR
jgi:hypothetical protein